MSARLVKLTRVDGGNERTCWINAALVELIEASISRSTGGQTYIFFHGGGHSIVVREAAERVAADLAFALEGSQ